MRKRLKKKIAKQQQQRAEQVQRLFEQLGPIFTNEILSELECPSRLSGTPEEWMEWDNKQHPHWTRTSWGGRPRQGILQVCREEEP